MRLEHKEYFDVLYPDEGMYLATKDKTMAFEGEIDLGILDSADNYIDITEEEYWEIMNKEGE